MQTASANSRTEIADGSLGALRHAGFVLTGIVNTMLGPMLPCLPRDGS